MKAQYMSTPGRAKKIIAAVWMAAISLSCVIVPFVSGVSTEESKKSKVLFTKLTLKLNKCECQFFLVCISYGYFLHTAFLCNFLPTIL